MSHLFRQSVLHLSPISLSALCLIFCFLYSGFLLSSAGQQPSKPEKSDFPATFDLLETKVRFESNGDSRKEVHAIVKIHSELGARQFANLNFDFNRSFQSVEIPLVRITHSSGGTADILPSAITDNPNPAVVNFPAYHDVRVKSVRILGLAPNDTLEYRVITTTTHHPLAPDFWLDHSFDRTGVVSHESFELDLPPSRKPAIRVNPSTPADIKRIGQSESSHIIYHWDRSTGDSGKPSDFSKEPEADVAVSTEEWEALSVRLDEKLTPEAKPLESTKTYEEATREITPRHLVSEQIKSKALALAKDAQSNRDKLEVFYDFVSQKITTVDLPLGSTGFVARRPENVLASGYATPEDKFVLFTALAAAARLNAVAALTGNCDQNDLARPTVFRHLIVRANDAKRVFWLDPSLEVAPFGLIAPDSGHCAFLLNRGFYAMNSTGHEWEKLNPEAPFPFTQHVSIDAGLESDGTLKSKVKYSIRGQNELLLRLAFHQSPREKWPEVAQLLALSDGFRGKVTTVSASDPYATRDPFTVEYEIIQPKFVDWSKSPVRIPAILPLVGLPDPPAAKPSASGSQNPATGPIELGTPLDVHTSVTLQVPPGTTIESPAGTTVDRDYATFSSSYASSGCTITASRHIHFIARELTADRASDYNAFVHAVQNDQAQRFTLFAPSLNEKGHAQKQN